MANTILTPAEAGKLSFLLIDDQRTALESLHICAMNMGATKNTRLSAFGDAIRQMRERSYDVVLCDYILGNGRSGQQLLEELRRFNLLPDETVFIMVTAEQSYEQVISAVELVPDDYILKPFSGEQLRVRIERVILKKRFFSDVFRLRREKQFDAALALLETLAKQDSNYGAHILRVKAETYLAAGQPANARTTYEEIIRAFEYPWARVGIAQSFRVQERYLEAKALVEEVARDSPNYIGAHDMQAQIALDMGEPDQAARILEKLAAKTPRNYVRKRQLAFAALANGDAEQAYAIMNDVLTNDTVAGAVTEEDRQQTARAAIAADLPEEAAMAMGSFNFDSLTDLAPNDRIARITLGLRTGMDGAEDCFHENRVWIRDTEFKPLIAMDVIGAALQLDDLELALSHTERLFLTGDMRQIFKVVHKTFVDAGHESEFRALQKNVALQRSGKIDAGAMSVGEAQCG